MLAYIAGPMRGYPEYNFPAFFAAEEWLRNKGIGAINPARMDIDLGFDPKKSLEVQPSFDMQSFIRRDVYAILSLDPQRDAICLLPGWQESTGARAEEALATWIGLSKLYYQP